MAIRTGLAAQLGIKAETVYGTAVVPDRFFYVETARINPLIRKRRVNARGAGIVQRTNLSQTVLTGATGQFVLPVMDSSFGIFNKLLLGANTTTQVGGTAEYTHSGVIDTTAAGYGASYTAQLGVPGTDGTVRAFTAEGGKCTGWELSCAEGEHMQLSIDMDFETVVTATALASPSFPSGWTPYVSEDCTWTIGGSAVFVRDWTITGTPTVDVDRRGQSTVLHLEPLWTGLYMVDAELDMEFNDLTHYNAFVAGTQQAAVMTAIGDTIPTASNPYKLTITFGKCDLELGETPQVSDDGIVRQTVTLHALFDGTTVPFTILWNNADTVA